MHVLCIYIHFTASFSCHLNGFKYVAVCSDNNKCLGAYYETASNGNIYTLQKQNPGYAPVHIMVRHSHIGQGTAGIHISTVYFFSHHDMRQLGLEIYAKSVLRQRDF